MSNSYSGNVSGTTQVQLTVDDGDGDSDSFIVSAVGGRPL
jgi:hypothetical protein